MSENESLLSQDESVTPAASDAAVSKSTEATATESTWSWADEVPGSGDAPDWFVADKYKSVAEQAKAYPELAKRFGSFTGAPEEYAVPAAEEIAKSVDLPEGLDLNLDPEDPLLKSFSEQAKEMGINQEGYNKLVSLYVKQQADDYAATITNVAEQKKQLGENADQRLGQINQWAKANMDEGLYSKLASSLTTADAVEAVEYLISKARNSALPNAAAMTHAPAVSKADYEEAMAEKDASGQLRYMTDPIYRAKVQRMGEQVFGTAPKKQIIG